MDDAWQKLKSRLARSAFRSKFRLQPSDVAYIESRGLDTIRLHAIDFVTRRLAPAQPRNDGKQTPMRGHPVFIAQHATATCCRGCLEKWHAVKQGHQLSDTEIEYVASMIMRWISEQGRK
jgi:exodeoxyribonuclease V alpha subunit